MLPPVRTALALALAALLAGCAAPRPEEAFFAIEPGRYADAFAAAKDVLASCRFELERVDARAGVLTTRAKPTSGLATPWDEEQTSFLMEWEDLLNRQLRRVRVTFRPALPAPEPPPDLRLFDGPIAATVEVVIDRRRRPGWRVESTSIRLSSFTRDPALVDRGLWPTYDVPFTQDDRFAAVLGRRIAARLVGAPPSPAGPG
jgi:hypothetical protein